MSNNEKNLNLELDDNQSILNSSINSNSLNTKSSKENLVATNQFSDGNFKVNVNVKFKYTNYDNDMKMNNLFNNEINKIDNNLSNGDDNSLLNYKNIHDKSINKLFNSINFIPDLTSTPSKKLLENDKNINKSELKSIENDIKTTRIESMKILDSKYDKSNLNKISTTNKLSPTNKLSTNSLSTTNKISTNSLSTTNKISTNRLSPQNKISTNRLSPTDKISTNRLSPINKLSSTKRSSPIKLSTNRSPNKPINEIDKKLTTNYDDKNLNYSDEHDDLYGISASPTFSDSSFLSYNSSASKNSQLTDQLYSIDSNTNPVVQVSIRIRPMNKIEKTNPQIKKIVDVDDSNSVLLLKDRRSPNETRFKFKFKNIFYTKTSNTDNENQEEIFSKIGKPFVQNLLDGIDLSYFAYGQTGSGKSYTIMGNEETSGIVFRFARDLFEIVNLNKRKDLEKLFNKLNCLEMNTDSRDADIVNDTTFTYNNLNNSTPLLIAKKKLSDNSKLFDTYDVIDSSTTNELIKLNKQIDNSFIEFNNHNFTTKDRIIRFNEKIQIFSDDDIAYNDKLQSDSEISSLDSLKNFDKNEEMMSLLDNENLKILKNLFVKFNNSNYYDFKINFQFKMSFYEIYSECIYDLLEPNEERLKSKIREHPTTGPFIENLTMKEIHNLKELTEYYEIANKRRSKSKTNLNERSSRSHAVCTIYIYQQHNYTIKSNFANQLTSKFRTATLNSKITFVDLAGSERALSSDQLSNERLKEGNSINKSLLTLGKVITKLAWINKCIKEKKEDFTNNTANPLFHVPYRDSILTWLLKDCFNGKCKTFMIATIAPTSNHYDQTLSTLRYAYKASKIKVPIKLNQLTFNKPSNQQKQLSSQQTNNSKRIYIEQLDNLKEKHRLERNKLSNDLANEKSELNKIKKDNNEYIFKKDQLDNIKEESDLDNTENKKYLDDKDQLINMKEYLNNKKMVDKLSKNVYHSSLLDRIKNLFNEYI